VSGTPRRAGAPGGRRPVASVRHPRQGREAVSGAQRTFGEAGQAGRRGGPPAEGSDGRRTRAAGAVERARGHGLRERATPHHPGMLGVSFWGASGGSAAARAPVGGVLLLSRGESQPMRGPDEGRQPRSRWGWMLVDNRGGERESSRESCAIRGGAPGGKWPVAAAGTKCCRAWRDRGWGQLVDCVFTASKQGRRADPAGSRLLRRCARQRPEPAARRAGASGAPPRRTERPWGRDPAQRRGGARRAPGALGALPNRALSRARTRSPCHRPRFRTAG